MELLEVKDLQNYRRGLDKIFDFVRLVDPLKMKVIKYEGKDFIIQGSSCYEFWNKKGFCNNCVTKSSVKEKRTITKIEYNDQGIFLTMATPILFEDNIYVVEMMKDITEVEEIKGTKGNEIKEAKNRIKELSAKIIKDELTGVYNRRYINRMLPKEILEAEKNNEKITVIMLDIDYFKEINDMYGHMAGDMVLINLTKTIKSNIRKDYDWVARFGGDEFLIMLKNADSNIANSIVREIQNNLRKNIIRYNNYILNITISFGACTVEPGTKTFDEILHEVDSNLMRAKRDGKNRLISS